MRLLGEDTLPEYRLVILEYGRKVGIMNKDGEIVCDWPVNPRYYTVPSKGKTKPKKGGGRMK